MPITDSNSSLSALDYHDVEIDLAGKFNQEKLVDVASFGVASNSAYARAIAPYYKTFASALKKVFVREGVAQKLVEVNKLLNSYGVELLVLDGYRPIALQKELWNHFIKIGEATIPNATDEQLVRFAGQFASDPRVFDPNNFRTWPVHNTGGAIDLTLRNLKDGQELFMGGIFDDADVVSSTRYYENPTHTSQSATEARRNRRLLYHAMCAVGFANYHHEWWHYDLGTQMWVMHGGNSRCAYYGRADLTA